MPSLCEAAVETSSEDVSQKLSYNNQLIESNHKNSRNSMYLVIPVTFSRMLIIFKNSSWNLNILLATLC